MEKILEACESLLEFCEKFSKLKIIFSQLSKNSWNFEKYASSLEIILETWSNSPLSLWEKILKAQRNQEKHFQSSKKISSSSEKIVGA